MQFTLRRKKSQVKKTSEPFENTTRYYRGRIIETLRELPSTTESGIALTELGLKVQEGFTPEKIPWLRGLVEGLQRDGLAFIAEDSALYDAGSDASRIRPSSSTSMTRRFEDDVCSWISVSRSGPQEREPMKPSRATMNGEQSVPTLPPTFGFLTDATLCIGCKACEVACKQWNQLPEESATDNFKLTGFSYDNTVDLGANTWRHVAFVERPTQDGIAWLMLSDVCKHCVHAGCLDACPTGAIIRTEFGTVVIQDDVCNGCGYCVPACPFGVPQLDHTDGGSHKCTLCYDRLLGGLSPACATACPTGSIRFGEVERVENGRPRPGDDAQGARGQRRAILWGR